MKGFFKAVIVVLCLMGAYAFLMGVPITWTKGFTVQNHFIPAAWCILAVVGLFVMAKFKYAR